MRRKFFFQQNDTKINNVNEGVLILELSSEAMSFSKFASFLSTVMIEVGKNFFECLPRDCKTAKLRNEGFSLFMLSSFFKTRADKVFTRGSQTMDICGTSIVTFETEVANFENDIASEKRP